MRVVAVWMESLRRLEGRDMRGHYNNNITVSLLALFQNDSMLLIWQVLRVEGEGGGA